MKLIDLLVQELPKRGGWPEGAKFITQDGPSVYSGGNVVSTWGVLPELRKHVNNREYWTAAGHNNGYGIKCFRDFELCQDYLSSIVARQEYEAALAASKQVAWDGSELPPEGAECEVKSGKDSWTLCKVVHSSSAGVAFIYLEEPDSCSSYLGVLDCICSQAALSQFRPIRTEAERRREDTKNAIAELCRASASNGHSADLIYDAIAAGKIPGIKLAD